MKGAVDVGPVERGDEGLVEGGDAGGNDAVRLVLQVLDLARADFGVAVGRHDAAKLRCRLHHEFDLTVEEVRNNPDWYFVLQEQPGEPKFAEEGADLATQTFTTPSNFFTRDDVSNAPVAQSAASASTLAGATFLLPFRLGIQGTAMLPET